MYDYVIVGAGSAGCVLAARLSEDPDVNVALLEAGGADTDDEIHIPAAFGALFKGRRDWDMSTEPEPQLEQAAHCYLPRAKMLGGCSSMNAMVYIRGNRRDYDEWAELRRRGLGLRRRAAVLQEGRGQRARRGHLPRRRGSAARAREPRR